MKFLHLSDLHLGKRLHGYSLLEDQRHFLFHVALPECVKRGARLILIAGDVYDAAVPSAEATRLLDDFLVEASARKMQVILIPGNHDSADRLAYASSFLKAFGVHVISTLEEALRPIEIEGVRFYGIPFSRNVDFLGVLEQPPEGLAARFAAFVEKMAIDEEKANVLLLHQALSTETGDIRFSGSETTFVGTSQILSPDIFSAFDYVALGHIHKAYAPSANSFYAGAPLKYHIDEAKDRRGLTFVEISGKKVEREFVPFAPLRDLLVEEGTFAELMAKKNEKDYVAAILDGEWVENARERLQRNSFPRLLSLRVPSVAGSASEAPVLDVVDPGLEASFSSFYAFMMGEELTPFQKKLSAEAEEYANGEDER